MKKILLSLLFLAFAIAGFAQSTRDVVKLKNGSVVKGIITEMKPNQSVKLTTSDGSVFVYSMDEVEEVLKEENTDTYSSASNNDVCMKATNDASSNYQGEGSLRGATWAATLLVSPIVGIIPAAIGASVEPADHQLNCPDQKLYQNNPEYKN